MYLVPFLSIVVTLAYRHILCNYLSLLLPKIEKSQLKNLNQKNSILKCGLLNLFFNQTDRAKKIIVPNYWNLRKLIGDHISRIHNKWYALISTKKISSMDLICFNHKWYIRAATNKKLSKYNKCWHSNSYKNSASMRNISSLIAVLY